MVKKVKRGTTTTTTGNEDKEEEEGYYKKRGSTVVGRVVVECEVRSSDSLHILAYEITQLRAPSMTFLLPLHNHISWCLLPCMLYAPLTDSTVRPRGLATCLPSYECLYLLICHLGFPDVRGIKGFGIYDQRGFAVLYEKAKSKGVPVYLYQRRPTKDVHIIFGSYFHI